MGIRWGSEGGLESERNDRGRLGKKVRGHRRLWRACGKVKEGLRGIRKRMGAVEEAHGKVRETKKARGRKREAWGYYGAESCLG